MTNRKLENRHAVNGKLKNDIRKMKKIQHCLVWSGRSASGPVQNSLL